MNWNIQFDIYQTVVQCLIETTLLGVQNPYLVNYSDFWGHPHSMHMPSHPSQTMILPPKWFLNNNMRIGFLVEKLYSVCTLFMGLLQEKSCVGYTPKSTPLVNWHINDLLRFAKNI